MLSGAITLLWRLRRGCSFHSSVLRCSLSTVHKLRTDAPHAGKKDVALVLRSPSESSSLPSLSPSSRKERTLSFSRERVEALIRRTNDFVSVEHDCQQEARRGTVDSELFRDWAHFLFKIPYSEKELLKASATCIDNLLHEHLDQLLQRIVGSKAIVPPTTTRVSSVHPRLFDHVSTGVYAWGRVSRDDSSAPQNAEALVLKLQQALTEKHGNRISVAGDDSATEEPGIRLSVQLYSALVYCWSQATSHDAASQRALYWFHEMMAKTSHKLRSTVSPKAWNALTRIHVRQRRFLDVSHLVDKYSYLNDGYTYVTLVEGWMNSESPHGRLRAYQSLQEGIHFCLEAQDSNALRQLLFQYLNRQPSSVDNCSSEQLLKQMVSLQEENPALEFLETKHFIVVMNALLQNVHHSDRQCYTEVVDTINDLFQTMVSLYEHAGCLQLKPNYQVLVVVLSALAKKQDLDALEQCEILLSKIEDTLLQADPSSEAIGNHSYNVVLDLYTRVPDLDDRKKRVEGLLKRMTDISRAHKNPALLPDKISLSALIRAIKQEGKPGFASEIDRIVRDEMERSDHTSMLPDENTYAIVLDAYCQSDDRRALSWANNLFNRLKSLPNCHIQPDAVMYTLLMKIHSKYGDVEGSDEVLSTMIRDFEGGNLRCRPSEIEFVSAMISWERSGRGDAPDGALRLFQQMMAQYENGNADCRPSKKSFGQLLVVLAKSNHKSKRQIADSLMATMNRLGIKPDLMIMNFYMRICSTVPNGGTKQERRESWEAAIATFHSVRASEWGANSHSYNTMLHACHNLLDDDDPSPKRLDEFCSIFPECLEDGKVDERILLSLRRFLPPEQYENLTGLDATRDQASRGKNKTSSK